MKFLAKERPLTPSWDLLGPSFELAKKYVWHIVYLSLLPNLLYAYASTLLGNNVYHDLVYGLSSRQHTGLILVGVAFAWSLIVYPGYIYFQTMAIRKKEVSISESSAFAGILPLVGVIIGTIFTYIYAFGPALRYGEITDRQTILPKIK
jgi:hypothetical protein